MSGYYETDNRGRFDPEIRETDFPVVGRGTRSRFVKHDPQRTVNFYHVFDPEGKKNAALFPTGGRSQAYVMDSASFARPGGAIAYGNYQFQVFGSSVIRIDAAGTQTVIGTLGSVFGYVGMISFYSTVAAAPMIVIVDGTNGWTYNITTGSFAMIVDPGFPALPSAIATLDGYVIVSQGNTGIMKVSALGNPTVYPGTIVMQTFGETVRQLAVLHKRLFVFGDRVTEVFYNAATPTSIFNADYNLRIEYGCDSQASVAVGYGCIIWLGRPQNGPPKFLMTTGTQPKIISDDGLNRIIANMEDPTDCESIGLYEQSGTTFYECSFTTDKQTWLYNLSAQLFTEKSEKNNRSALRTIVFFDNKYFCGTYIDNVLYYFGEQYGANGDEPIVRTRITTIFSHPFYHPININRIIVDALPGNVLYPVRRDYPPSDPNIYLSVSKDGGIVFEPIRKAPIGMSGEFENKVIFDNFGRGRAWVFKIEIYSEAVQAILGGGMSYFVEST